MGFLGLFKPNTKKLKEKKDIKGLIKALNYKKDWGVRQTASEALGKIGKPAVEPLMAALKEHWGDVRWAAAWALGEIKNTKAVEPLITVLKDQFECVRGAAVEALEKIGDTQAIGPLEKLAQNDSYQDVRQTAQKALAKIRGK